MSDFGVYTTENPRPGMRGFCRIDSDFDIRSNAFLGEEKPEEELMGKSKPSPAVAYNSSRRCC